MKSTSVVETPAYLAMLRRLIRRAGLRVGNGDVEDFSELVKCAAELDLAVQVAVTGLRSNGTTWREIGAATGTSHVAALKKWGARNPEPRIPGDGIHASVTNGKSSRATL